jgi:hypothetical protein
MLVEHLGDRGGDDGPLVPTLKAFRILLTFTVPIDRIGSRG